MKQIFIKLTLITALLTSMIIAKEPRHSTPITMTPAMKIFKQKMRKGCRGTAIRFSRTHTRSQWEIIKKNDLLRREARILCPRLDTSLLSSKDWNQIYSFIIENSKDNPIILKC